MLLLYPVDLMQSGEAAASYSPFYQARPKALGPGLKGEPNPFFIIPVAPIRQWYEHCLERAFFSKTSRKIQKIHVGA